MSHTVPSLADVQNERDDRCIPINQVGITDLRYPIVVLDRQQEQQQTTATLSDVRSLPHHFKRNAHRVACRDPTVHRGTHECGPSVHIAELKQRLVRQSARIEVNFDYFLDRARQSAVPKGIDAYQCSLIGEANAERRLCA